MFFSVMASSPIGSFRHQSACREARLGDTDWFKKASAIIGLDPFHRSATEAFTSRTRSARVSLAILGRGHVVQFGPIWIKQQAREPAPPLRHRIEDAAPRRDGEQRSEDMRFQEWTHFNVSWGGPTTQFLPS
jgi:hypothetical protein